MELDEYSGQQTPTEAIEETRGQDVPQFSAFYVLCSYLNLLRAFVWSATSMGCAWDDMEISCHEYPG